MNPATFNRATHFSVVWAFMLCFITILEWRSLDRDPMKADILSPFIQRHIEITPGQAQTDRAAPIDSPGVEPAKGPQTVVELGFDGPLFLACFFIPIIVFHGIGALFTHLRKHLEP